MGNRVQYVVTERLGSRVRAKSIRQLRYRDWDPVRKKRKTKMKKLMFAIAAAAAGTVLADVSSANVVGYQTVTIPAQQQTMIGVQFQGIGGESISVQDLFPDPLGQGCFTGAASVSKAGDADQLAYWDINENGHYVYLYLNNTTSTSEVNKKRRNKWCVVDMQSKLSPAAKAFWGSNGEASIAKLQPGMGLWLIRKNYATPTNVTMAGQVTVAQSGLSIALRTGQNMFTCGFTQPFAPNPDVAYNDESKRIDWLAKECVGAASVSKAGDADQLSFWDINENGHYVYLYLNNTTSTSEVNKKRKGHWCVVDMQSRLSPEAKAFWGSNGEASPAVIPAGRGVWYIRNAASTNFVLTLDQPYSL